MVNDVNTSFAKRAISELGRDCLEYLVPIKGDLDVYRTVYDNFGSKAYAAGVAGALGVAKYALILGGLYEILK